MSEWYDDDELFELMRTKLFTGVVGDVMDKLGLKTQFLPPNLNVLDPAMVIAGRAMTVLEADVHVEVAENSANTLMAKPFGLMFEALDNLSKNDVYICTGASPRFALWGGLMSIRATYLKAAGAVLDGFVRDSQEILELGFPIACQGCYAQDQGPRGKVLDYNVPVKIGEAQILPGDIIYGDRDGVLCVPRAHERKVIDAALVKVSGESQVREALNNGMSVVEAFDTFQIM